MLTVVAVLMKKQTIKTSKNWLHFVVLALAVILLIPYVDLLSMEHSAAKDAERFSWPEILLAEVIPEPKSNLGEIFRNSEESLVLYVYKTSAADYSRYVDACGEKGFAVEAEQTEMTYSAFNADGYELSLFYDASDEVMNISVDAAKQYGTLVWPDSGMANMIPVPKSTTGEIVQDDEKGFAAYISNIPIEEFSAYVSSCADKGFSLETSESEKSYSAENDDGYQLSVSYQGNGVISIFVNEPEYAVSIEIECMENLLFSTYDVDVYVDDSLQGTIDHGSTETYNLNMTKGVYEIRFVNSKDDEITGAAAIDIHQDESLKYKISCTSSQINVETIQGTITEHGEDEAAMPRAASSYKYENYVDVQTELSEAGFTNISFEVLYDIVIGWAEEGEVDSVSVNGSTEFEQGDIFKKDAPIVITYHMNEEDDPNKPVENDPSGSSAETEPAQNLTAENCLDLAALLALRDPGDPSVAAFASKYYGQVIEFDGCVNSIQNHEDYTTRWDVLLGAGNFDENSAIGPNFRLTNVNFSDMNVSGGDSIYAGLNVHVIAEVGTYNPNPQLFELDIISIHIRD